MSFRIVVTGSRRWVDGLEANLIRNKMILTVEAAVTMGISLMSGACVCEGEIVIVQGGAAGADAIAKAFAERQHWAVETFPADWSRHGRGAGPIRNKAMLDAGAACVLAFPFGDHLTSPGTWNCIMQAAQRGIPAAIFPRPTLEETRAVPP